MHRHKFYRLDALKWILDRCDDPFDFHTHSNDNKKAGIAGFFISSRDHQDPERVTIYCFAATLTVFSFIPPPNALYRSIALFKRSCRAWIKACCAENRSRCASS